jgi:hypothetical protein
MDNQEIRAALDHHWEATVALDINRSHDIYHDDVVAEFPQSDELVNTTYTNSGHITLLNIVLRFCGYGEKDISGYLK